RADLLLRRGELEAARSIYAELAQKTADPDRLRTLDVKRLAPPGIGRDAIVMLLIGDADGPSWDVAAAKLGEWSALDPKDGLPEYLLGRNLMGRGRMRHAAEYLERALGKRLPEPHVRDEALRLRLVAACAEGDTAAARRARDALLARDLSAARREGLQRFSERCGLPMDAASSAFAEPRCTRRTLRGRGRDGAEQVLLRHAEGHGRGDTEEHVARHDDVPADARALFAEERDAERERSPRVVGGHHQGPEIVVPVVDEAEQQQRD